MPRRTNNHAVFAGNKPKGSEPSRSWWVGVPRDSWHEVVAKENERMSPITGSQTFHAGKPVSVRPER